MAKQFPSVILLRINEDGSRPIRELPTTNAVKPGQLVEFTKDANGNLAYKLATGVDAVSVPIVAIESPYFGENTQALAGTYNAGESCRAQALQAGDEFLAAIPASTTIVVGDVLNCNAGNWQKATAGAGMAVAIEDMATTTGTGHVKAFKL